MVPKKEEVNSGGRVVPMPETSMQENFTPIDVTGEAITSTQMEKYLMDNGMQDIKTEPDKSSSLMEIYWKALGAMGNGKESSLLPT